MGAQRELARAEGANTPSKTRSSITHGPVGDLPVSSAEGGDLANICWRKEGRKEGREGGKAFLLKHKDQKMQTKTKRGREERL